MPESKKKVENFTVGQSYDANGRSQSPGDSVGF
jgi:hypothetical protein